ncbi:MAG: hypothetical protein R2837_10615 [Aliarcobacter sp.]
MSRSLIESAYSINNIEHIYLRDNSEQLNSFVDVEPGNYPPRMDFEVYTHNLKKDDVFILKFDDGGRATFAVNNKEVKIIDIFLKNDFQGQSILKNIVAALRVYISKDYPTVKFITLNSLNTGIIAWHKMNFEFYNKLDKMGIRNVLSNHLQRKVDLKDLTKDEIENNNCYEVLARNNYTSIPMFLKVK